MLLGVVVVVLGVVLVGVTLGVVLVGVCVFGVVLVGFEVLVGAVLGVVGAVLGGTNFPVKLHIFININSTQSLLFIDPLYSIAEVLAIDKAFNKNLNGAIFCWSKYR